MGDMPKLALATAITGMLSLSDVTVQPKVAKPESSRSRKRRQDKRSKRRQSRAAKRKGRR